MTLLRTMYFVIDDGYNTSYMSAIFVGLFCEKSIIEKIMLTNTYQCEGHTTYLQKLIKHKFVDSIRNNISVTSNVLNEIRNYAYLCGWKLSMPLLDLMDSYNPTDFLFFLLDIFKIPLIEIDNSPQHCITLDKLDSNLTKMYNIWTQYHTIDNIPPFLIFKIDRDIIGNAPVDYMTKIKLFKSEHLYGDIKWIFHCIICKASNNLYYCVIMINEILYVWYEKQCPNLFVLDLEDQNGITKIKTESICVIYKRNTSI